MNCKTKHISAVHVTFLLLAFFAGAQLFAQTTYDFYVADDTYEDNRDAGGGAGKLHSGSITRSVDPEGGPADLLVGSLYSWRHQRTIDISGKLNFDGSGEIIATWTESVPQRVRVKKRWVTRYVDVQKSATNSITWQDAWWVAPILGTWTNAEDGQSGVFGGYVP